MKCSYCKSNIFGSYFQTPKGKLICARCKSKLEFCQKCGEFSEDINRVDGVDICSNCLGKSSNCYVCNKSLISGFYDYQIGKQKFQICRSCFENAEICSVCNVKILDENYVVEKGEIICSNCSKHSKKCSVCSEIIRKQYFEINGKTVCKKCLNSDRVCSNCGIAINKPIYVSNKPFCMKCSDKFPKCDFCRDAIVGRYIVSKERKICVKCQRKVDRCTICGTFDNDLKYVKREKVCKSCIEDLKTCKICDCVIKGRYWVIDGETYCEKCKKSSKTCDVCSKPFGVKKWDLLDGRKYCESCYNSGIFNGSKALVISNIIRSFLKNAYQIELFKTYEFELVNKKRMLAISKNPKSIGFCAGTSEKNKVYIQEALPKSLFYSTFTHEYVHAWQNENMVNRTNKIITEGFAEWIAYRVLEKFNFFDELENFGNTQDEYGIGFHKMLKLERKFGTQELIERIRKSKSLGFFV